MTAEVNHKRRTRSGAGLGIDAAGGPVIDPTENVKALSEALSQRQDDLRDLNNKYLDARLDAIKEVVTLMAAHSKEIRDLESKRVDAVREIDVIARNTAASQALTGIQTLAASTSAEREALRSLVTTTAATIAAQTDRIVQAMTDRIATLEKASYTGLGKQAVIDPAMTELVAEVKKLSAAGAEISGKTAGISLSAAVVMGGITIISGLLGIAGVIYAVLKP